MLLERSSSSIVKAPWTPNTLYVLTPDQFISVRLWNGIKYKLHRALGNYLHTTPTKLRCNDRKCLYVFPSLLSLLSDVVHCEHSLKDSRCGRSPSTRVINRRWCSHQLQVITIHRRCTAGMQQLSELFLLLCVDINSTVATKSLQLSNQVEWRTVQHPSYSPVIMQLPMIFCRI